MTTTGSFRINGWRPVAFALVAWLGVAGCNNIETTTQLVVDISIDPLLYGIHDTYDVVAAGLVVHSWSRTAPNKDNANLQTLVFVPNDLDSFVMRLRADGMPIAEATLAYIDGVAVVVPFAVGPACSSAALCTPVGPTNNLPTYSLDCEEFQVGACGDFCVNVAFDDQHCGQCFNPCPVGTMCRYGDCL